MLDRYIHGSITRKSPEADVPIILQDSIENKLGGAANVALNIQSLSGKASLLSVIGDDHVGHEIQSLLDLNTEFISTHIIKEAGRISTSKTRLIADNQHVARIDNESTTDISTKSIELLLTALTDCIQKESIDLVILQDYNKGVLTTDSIKKILAYAKKHNIPVAVDPKNKNFLNYHSCTIFKPNLTELKNAFPTANIELDNPKNLLSLIQENLNPEISIVTLGEKGLLIADRTENLHVYGLSSEKIDVCGAGDAVIAAISLAYTLKWSLMEMAKFANSIGFLSCLRVGVNPVKIQDYDLELPSLNYDIKAQKI